MWTGWMAVALLVLLAGCGGAVSPEKEYQAGVADLRAGRLQDGKARIEAALEKKAEQASSSRKKKDRINVVTGGPWTDSRSGWMQVSLFAIENSAYSSGSW